MNLEHTTLMDVILYLLMVLSIIVLIIGACIGLELMIVIPGILIFIILMVFLVLNTYRFLKFKR